MIPRYPAFGFVFLLFIFSYALRATAQPTLPGITGTADKGVIVLSWNCQYAGVKAISVSRSPDSAGNYSVIGNVKNVEQGLQVFVDGHPIPGKNCYRLGLVFKSGLKWSSNYYCTYMASATPESAKLPANDSLQKLIVTQDIPKPGRPAPAAEVNNTATTAHDPFKNEGTETASGPAKQAATATPAHEITEKSRDDKTNAQPKISIAFGADTAHLSEKNSNPGVPAIPRKKIVISFEEADESLSTLIRSKFIFTDPVTGNIMLDMPDDVATHHYSVKFFDDKNNMITEVPRINAPKIIMDKRNFQRRGIYKFKLRRDLVELEAGYLTINPNPVR